MNEIVYKSERVTIYHGDCRQILPQIGHVDAVIQDPPYGIAHPCSFHKRGRGNLASCNDWPDVLGDNKPFDPSPWVAFDNVILWGANYFADRLPVRSGWLVWDKMRPDDLDQSTCELAWANQVKGCRRFRHLWNGMMKASEQGQSYHPTQKPVALMSWCIQQAQIQPGATIFDGYMGSGPVGVAAMQAGCRYIGCEIHRPYCDIAIRRIQAAESQPALPFEAPVEMENLKLFEGQP